MSKIVNEAKIKNKLIVRIRELLEHRAFWLYLLVDEAEKRGLDPEEFASAAITRCGISQGTDLQKKSGTKSLKGLRKTLFTRAARWVFEMDLVENTDDTLYLDFHYCPLVKAWQKAGCSDEEIARLSGPGWPDPLSWYVRSCLCRALRVMRSFAAAVCRNRPRGLLVRLDVSQRADVIALCRLYYKHFNHK